jgi:hypothetical protein
MMAEAALPLTVLVEVACHIPKFFKFWNVKLNSNLRLA